jgi:tryptophanyl-tRNA synthetase
MSCSTSKSAVRKSNRFARTFSYLVLLVLFRSTIIPVGEDQQQHLELARDIAQTFNHRFGEVFPLPRHVISKPSSSSHFLVVIINSY